MLSIAFTTVIGSVKLSWWFPYVVCIPLYIWLSKEYFNNRNQNIKGISAIVFRNAIAPYFAAIVYSALIVIVGEGIVNSVPRSLSVTARAIAAVSLSVILFAYYQDDIMAIIGDSLILSYFWTLLNAFICIGVEGYRVYLSNFTKVISTGYNGFFEMHDVGLSIGMVLLYEVMFFNKKELFRLVLLCGVFILCWKRIAFAALLCTLFIWFFTRRRHQSFKNFQINLLMTGVLFSCFAYVALIESGMIYVIASRIGLDLTNRRFLFSFVQRLYEWKITFLGHGLGSVGKYFKTVQGTTAGARAGGFLGVHNDILKTYIELGFVGSFLWFFWYTWWFPMIISQRVGKGIARYVYCLITIYAYIIYATDNTTEYFIFQTVLYSFVLFGCAREKNERRNYEIHKT